MSNKKIGGLYSNEFKIKVLEYYFKNGGDSKFGLKAKTAHHFDIDHKTVSRMLSNKEIVNDALNNVAKQQKRSIEELCEETSFNLGTSTPERNSKISSESAASPLNKDNNESKSAPIESSVIELPEDPDFSLLKKSISSPASETVHFARLLLTGTEEVKKILTNECELIFECKICRNLFRSIVNLLAHKRIYCQEEVDVRHLFQKSTSYSVNSESSTVVVEQESTLNPATDAGGGGGGIIGQRELKIDVIANKLANKKSSSRATSEQLSSSTHKGSSSYYNRLHKVNEARKILNKNCAVLLEDIAGVSSAVYQTFIPPKENEQPKETMQQLAGKHMYNKREKEVHLDNIGYIIEDEGKRNDKESEKESLVSSSSSSGIPQEAKDPTLKSISYTCTSCTEKFAEKKDLSIHVAREHGIERTIFTCPICNSMFLSIHGCLKHLVKIHKKKKRQRERLRQVIKSRVSKKLLTTKELVKLGLSKTNEDKLQSSVAFPKSNESSKANSYPKRNEDGAKAKSLGHLCVRCGQTFLTPGALGSHLLHCKVTKLSNSHQTSLTPEKKIGIQIRKDYKKETKPESLSLSLNVPESSANESDFNREIQTRIKEFCVVKKLFCIPCDRKYNSLTILKRHAAHHLGWTRFSCNKCSFQSYEKYIITQHCLSEHKVIPKDIDDHVTKEDKLGTFRFYLASTNAAKFSNSEEKWDFVQNGHSSSPSECSASAISEDNLSLKSDHENQDEESANVAYRELIENIDIDNETKTAESDPLKIDISDRLNYEKNYRPQRLRRHTQQKDFKYDSSKSVPLVGEEIKPPGVFSLRVRNVSTSSLSNKRKDHSPSDEPPQKRPFVEAPADKVVTSVESSPVPSVNTIATTKTFLIPAPVKALDEVKADETPSLLNNKPTLIAKIEKIISSDTKDPSSAPFIIKIEKDTSQNIINKSEGKFVIAKPVLDVSAVNRIEKPNEAHNTVSESNKTDSTVNNSALTNKDTPISNAKKNV